MRLSYRDNFANWDELTLYRDIAIGISFTKCQNVPDYKPLFVELLTDFCKSKGCDVLVKGQLKESMLGDI